MLQASQCTWPGKSPMLTVVAFETRQRGHNTSQRDSSSPSRTDCKNSSTTSRGLIFQRCASIRPGGTSNTHTHMGDEYTVILEGSFSDEAGLYHKGDFLLRDASDQHTPVATLDKYCICLAVTEAPIQLTGFFGWLLNPFIRRSYA